MWHSTSSGRNRGREGGHWSPSDDSFDIVTAEHVLAPIKRNLLFRLMHAVLSPWRWMFRKRPIQQGPSRRVSGVYYPID